MMYSCYLEGFRIASDRIASDDLTGTRSCRNVFRRPSVCLFNRNQGQILIEL